MTGAIVQGAIKVLPMVAKSAVGASIFSAGKKMLGFGDDKKDDDKKDEAKNQASKDQTGAQYQNQLQPGSQGFSTMPGQQVMGPIGYPLVPAAPGAAAMLGQQSPYVSAVPGLQGQGQTSMAPLLAAGAGAGAAGLAVASPGVQASAQSSTATEAQPFSGEKDSKLLSMGKTGLAALAGGAGAFMLKQKERGDIGESIKAAIAGAGSGGFAKMAYDSTQSEGQGLRAGFQSAAASALGSLVKDGGPSPLSAALTGGGAGLLGNKLHDSLESSGNSKSADASAGASLAASLGYSVTGDKSTSLLAGLGGAGLGTAAGEVDRGGSLGDLVKAANPFDDEKVEKSAKPTQAGPELA